MQQEIWQNHMQTPFAATGRENRFADWLKRSLKETYLVKDYMDQDSYYGIHRIGDGWVYRDYAPDAKQIYLAGDFNNWEYENSPMLSLGNGNWVLFLPGKRTLWESCRIKTIVVNG